MKKYACILLNICVWKSMYAQNKVYSNMYIYIYEYIYIYIHIYLYTYYTYTDA